MPSVMSVRSWVGLHVPSLIFTGWVKTFLSDDSDGTGSSSESSGRALGFGYRKALLLCEGKRA